MVEYSEFIKGIIEGIALYGTACASGLLLLDMYKKRKTFFIKDLHQTVEDRSCSTFIVGVQGSGKTYLAMKLFLEDIKKGYGALWLSTQGIDNNDLLNYIPEDKIEKVILLRPYSDRLRGINLFKRYTKSPLERMLIADSVVVLFERLFNDIKDSMKSVLTASTLALLEYSDITNTTVCLWDLYIFFTDEEFRQQIVDTIKNKTIIDMINDFKETHTKTSLEAILRRFRTMLYNDNMIAFLSYKYNDIDLLEAVKKRKIIICDFLAGGVGGKGIGKANSSFLAELIVSKFQLIAETRNIHSSLFPLYLDEFPTYTSTASNIKDFIDLNRQRRMPVILICQRRYQLSKELQEAVDACGTKYILKLNPNDWSHYEKMYPQYKDKIPNMKVRDCIKDILSYGKNYVNFGKTEDIGEKYNLGKEIEKRNEGKYTVQEIVKNIKSNSISEKIHEFIKFQ